MTSAKRTRRASILIPTCGRVSALKETLTSLCLVRIPNDLEVELIVVENVIRAGTEDVVAGLSVRSFSTRYLFEPTPGKSRALNLAIAASSSDILVFTDDDVQFSVDWLELLCRPILNGDAEAVAGGVVLAPHLLRSWMNHTHRAWLASTADYLSSDAVFEMCGANMAFTRRAFDRVGAFDVELGPGITGGGEESLMSWQLIRAGIDIYPALDVVIEHHPSTDRLSYPAWLNAARLKGNTHGYLMHHWKHEQVSFPLVRRLWYQCKLGVRRCLSPRRPTTEGIAPWELSYIEEIAKYGRFAEERKRPRHYPYQGIRKLSRLSE